MYSVSKLKRFDLFEKIESDLTVKTNNGGILAIASWALIIVLVLNEISTHRYANLSTKENPKVDTSLGKDRRMSVNINITFPGLHCDDLHLDVMDVAGDSHSNLDNDKEHLMIKRRLNLDGSPIRANAETVKANKAAMEELKRQEIKKATLKEDYCGPCYGASSDVRKCCNTCDELLEAYREKRWDAISITYTSEQCIREGRDKKEIKRMSKGEGCNIAGTLRVNKVAGNFHIAMGEAVDTNGRHIHQFLPDDAINFNASHIINELSFGKKVPAGLDSASEKESLNGITKVVKAETGASGVFHYFVKIVPTNYTDSKGNVVLETNRYSYTERFTPLMTDLDEEHYALGDNENTAGADVGGQKKPGQTHEHHWKQNSILPGVFFIYEIYPFALEVSKEYVPLSHLIIRLMAVIGGVLTVSSWIDSAMYSRERKK